MLPIDEAAEQPKAEHYVYIEDEHGDRTEIHLSDNPESAAAYFKAITAFMSELDTRKEIRIVLESSTTDAKWREQRISVIEDWRPLP